MTIVYHMKRGGKTVAEVVALDNGKCIVSWPTSTIVYDNEDAARAVHITHMGGRGEPTWFVPQMGSGGSFAWGMDCAALDENEGAPFASITDNYKLDDPAAPSAWTDSGHPIDQPSFLAGYLAQMARQSSSREALLAEIREFAKKQRALRGGRTP
jgi:hypothetical protein